MVMTSADFLVGTSFLVANESGYITVVTCPTPRTHEDVGLAWRASIMGRVVHFGKKMTVTSRWSMALVVTAVVVVAAVILIRTIGRRSTIPTIRTSAFFIGEDRGPKFPICIALKILIRGYVTMVTHVLAWPSHMFRIRGRRISVHRIRMVAIMLLAVPIGGFMFSFDFRR
jgi:hypothetical protein